MAFQTPLTITETIQHIEDKTYLLPSIQREFIWKPEKIARLFDSLMRKFPIGSFLFWRVERQKILDFHFYEFLRNYHQRKQRHNPKANVAGYNEVMAILDGQQRLTSLYIGLKGTYAYKLPRKFVENDAAYPIRQLYLNLICESPDEEDIYDFRFLTENEAKESDEKSFWFKVGDILDLKEEHEVNSFLIDKEILAGDQTRAKFANKTLFRLHSLVHKDAVINYFLETEQKLDKVVKIFVRVNSQGEPLSYADLLLSIATAEWKNKEAREEFNSFVDDINNTGNGFSFNKDFVLKACLVLCDFKNIVFKVDNFTKDAMGVIEREWDGIKKAIQLSVEIVSDLGFSSQRLVSNYVIIPIAYFLMKNKLAQSFRFAQKYSEERKEIQKWVQLAIINQVFGGHTDNTLREIRSLIEPGCDIFPLNKIVETLKGTPRSLELSAEEIENILLYKYGGDYTFAALSLLYPTLDYRKLFHLDHIFPKSQFRRDILKKRNVKEDDIRFYLENFDTLANLQLIEGPENVEKRAMDFDLWLQETYKGKDEKNDFMRRNYIPKGINIEFCNFREFINERQRLLKEEYASLIG